jgi:hypothetical protein
VVRRDFDLQAVYAALDEQRRARAMTWADVTREINARFRDVPGHRPIAQSTPFVMKVVGWLDQPATAFTRASKR